ncbi:MAG TPA: uroporphyrinogen-III synthase [Thioalkalivibrio sp.]|nr:uroporphyrinogen-III synthase [Thioalkalivibrio sp.]
MQPETRTDELALSHLKVVITRPAHQADALCAQIEAAGGRAVRFPVLEILEPNDSKPLLELIDRLEEFDIAVFISPNAVRKAMNLIRSRRAFPESTKIAAIGRKSAQELKGFGRIADIYPNKRFDSEALLELPEMQDVGGKRVVIFRGDGGREMLGDTLRARGAIVEYANAYRRGRPDTDNGEILYLWSRNELDVILVTSSEGLRNLFDMVGKLGQMWLRSTPLIVGGERMLETAHELGFKVEPEVAADPSDEAMMEALLHWARNRKAEHE